MKEAARQQRNQQRLTECFPAFATTLRQVITDMEAQGFRPRIQDAFRTEAEQLEDFKKGTSKVKFGFHNITGAGGRKESLAVDLLDDDNPLDPPRRYLILLAEAARARGLQTGILFGLPAPLRKGANQAIAARNFDAKVKIGFDPTHVEVADISISEARAGKRP
jgi:hypothetical protein